jgi:hypothetical protein
MRRVAAATLILSAVTLPVRAQGSRDKPTSQPVTISGRVVADETSEPIVNARVTLTTAGLGTPVVLADGDDTLR